MRHHRGRGLWSSFRRFASASFSDRGSAGMGRAGDIGEDIVFMGDPLTGAGTIVIGTEL
jgi:hypothetical protein